MKSKQAPSRVQGIALVLIPSILWGLNSVFNGRAVSHYQISPLELTGIRTLLAGILLLIVSWRQGILPSRQSLLRPRAILLFLAFGLIGIMFNTQSYLRAIVHTNPSTATMLQFTSPALLVIIEALRQRRSPNLKEWLAILAMLLGIFFISTHGRLGALVISPLGLFWGLMASASLIGYNLLSVPLMADFHPTFVTGLGMSISGISLLPYIQWTTTFSGQPLDFYLTLAFIIVVGTALNYVLYLRGLNILGPASAAMLGTIEPVAATFFTVMILGTQFTGMDYLGMACIMMTILLTL